MIADRSKSSPAGGFRRRAAAIFPVTTWIAVAFCAPAPFAFAETPDLSVLEGPLHIELEDGREHTGRPVSFQDDVLYLREEMTGGSVERGFRIQQIRTTHFPGVEIETAASDLLNRDEWEDALPLLEALWLHRAPFLQLIDEPMHAKLRTLADLRLRAGRPGRAVALAQQLHPFAETEDDRLFLQGVTLQAHFAMELYDRADELAREWIDLHGRFPRSALGWKILADLALREENFEEAGWIALEPVAFAGPGDIPFLADCYALGILALHKTEQPDRARSVAAEMHDLGLPWPEEARFEDLREHYKPLDEDRKSPAVKETEEDLDLRPAEEDLNLPLQNVRKLTGRGE